MRKLILLLSMLAVLAAPHTAVGEAASQVIRQPDASAHLAVRDAERLVLGFYYAWFDENTWRRDVVPDMPVATYHSADRGAISRHVDQAKASGIDALVLSWLGPNNPTDTNLTTLLAVAQEKGLRVSLTFETNSPFLGSQEAITGALRYAIDKYSGQPNFLRHKGKPVIFFWRTRQVAVGTWQQIRDQVDPNRSTIWIAEGDDPSYLQAFDGIYLYSIAWSQNVSNTLAAFAAKIASWETRLGSAKIWAATVMPGYDDRTTGRPDAFVVNRQDGQYYTSTWNAAMATSPDWIVITSFNEWVEGTQIEPSVTYGDRYLNLTRDMAARFKATAKGQPQGLSPSSPDYDVANGHFFTQGAGQQPGSGDLGFTVSNDGGVRFWDEFRRLGGVGGVGYPISRRFQWNGFVVQAMQKGVLQWRPEAGRAYLVNVFDQMTDAGKDDWLLSARSTPAPLGPEFDAGKTPAQIAGARLALLDEHPAIKRRYLAASDPPVVYGLPTSRVTDNGSHLAIRLQRAVIQQWKVDVPWARAGDVVVANGGDVGKEAGLYPPEALEPEAPPS